MTAGNRERRYTKLKKVRLIVDAGRSGFVGALGKVRGRKSVVALGCQAKPE